MAIASTDIKYYHPLTTAEGAAHGGGINTADEILTTLHDKFDAVSGDEAVAGAHNFRKAFAMLGAGAGASVLSTPVLWMTTTEGTTAERIYFTTGTVDKRSDWPNTDITHISTAWTRATVKTDGISLANWSSGSANAVGIWECRVVDAGCGSVATDRIDFTLEGDTA